MPGTSDSAFVESGWTASITQAGGTCGTLTVGGNTSDGNVQASAGGLAVASYLYLGAYAGHKGTFYLSGQAALSSAYETIGYAGSGTFNQSGGSNALSSFLYLGYSSATGLGTYNLSGGLVSADTEFIGSSGIGVFNQTGGTNTVNGNAAVGRGYYLLGGGLLAGGNEGTILVSNGGFQAASGTLDCSAFGGISTLSGALVDLSGNVVNTASTSLSVDTNSLLILPAMSASAAYASYSNSGLTDIVGTTLNISAGTGFGGWGAVPNAVSCSGTITAASGGWIDLNGGLALSASGHVDLGSGTLTVNDSTFSGMNGGTLAGGTMVVGLAGSGAFTQSGGINTTGTLLLASSSASRATYNLRGGLLRVSSMSVGSGAAVFNDSGGTLQAAASFSSDVPMVLAATGSNAPFDTSGNTLTITAALSGSGSLYKTGAGVLVLSGTDTYRGGTYVAAGILRVLDPASLLNGSGLTVGEGAVPMTFGGAATVAGSAEPIASAADIPAQGAAANSVPEPSGLALLAATVFLFSTQRRMKP